MPWPAERAREFDQAALVGDGEKGARDAAEIGHELSDVIPEAAQRLSGIHNHNRLL